MAEAIAGLAVASNIVAVIQIADSVISLCYGFVGKARGAVKEISDMATAVTALKVLLEALKCFVQDGENASRLPLLSSLSHPNGPLETCHTLLAEIEDKLQSKRTRSGSLGIIWPWQYDEMSRILQTIEKQKSLMSLALQGDIATTTLAIEDKVKDIHHIIHDEKDAKIIQWLKKVDPESNHVAACKKREPSTGEWFVLSSEFSHWLLPKRSLWLHGIPGAGKTVLCSTIIESVKSRCPRNAACLYFYFDFSDGQKKIVRNMLCSFLAQLCWDEVPSQVRGLYERCQNGTREATDDQLIETLFEIANNGRLIYLIVDALDESSEREILLNVIQQIMHSNCDINLLVTSRKEHDIETELKGCVHHIVSMEDKRVDPDIELHIHQCLHNDRDLCKWDAAVKQEIVECLTSGVHGM